MRETQLVLELVPSQVQLRLSSVEDIAEDGLKGSVAEHQVKGIAPQGRQSPDVCPPPDVLDLSRSCVNADRGVEDSPHEAVSLTRAAGSEELVGVEEKKAGRVDHSLLSAKVHPLPLSLRDASQDAWTEPRLDLHELKRNCPPWDDVLPLVHGSSRHDPMSLLRSRADPAPPRRHV